LICEKCWSSHYDHEANLLDVYMSRLRAKFRSHSGTARVQDRARRRLSTAVKSIGARLALWYAGAATLTMVALFVVGYYLLENQLIRGLDLLNKAQFAQIRAHLGEDFAP